MAEASREFIESCRSDGPGNGPGWRALGETPPMLRWSERSRSDALRGRHTGIERAVQRDILPRLAPREVAVAGATGIPDGRIEMFGRLVLSRDLPRAMEYLDRSRSRGMTTEALYLELLAPTARHFGDLWTEDTLDFGQVTIGLGNLHRLLRNLGPDAPATAPMPAASGPRRDGRNAGRRGLLVAAPGEQHTFGLAMVTAFFRRAGWVIWSGAPTSPAELTGIVRQNWFDVVGFSLAYEGRLDGLLAGIRDIRQASRNRRIRIMVGGPVFTEHPEFVAQVGAHAMAIDGQQAVMEAERLLTQLPVYG